MTLPCGSTEQVLSCPAVSLEVLDLADGSLSDAALKLLFQLLPNTGRSLQRLDVSGNGRVDAAVVASFTESLANMRCLNLCGSLMGSVKGPLVSFETLSRLDLLEELDLSNFNLNEVSLGAIERYLLRLSAASQSPVGEAGPACVLRRLVLKNCGITGYAAGRIFQAVAGLNLHLDLGSNPLETGIEYLAQAIGLCCKGTFGLHLDMVEFRDEADFVKLIQALTCNKYICFLSLVGTAPTPTEEALCSPQMCDALERFFAANRSVRFLDVSGFSGKLDEGQLGKGFGRSLRGLAHNKTMTHLRMRNQNIHDDVGSLGSVISTNLTLRSVDCQDNNLNLTGLRHLAQRLAGNQSIVDFPVDRHEQERILARSLPDVPARRSKRKGAPDRHSEDQVTLLRNEIRHSVLELQSCVERNRTASEGQRGVLSFENAAEAGGSPGWPSLHLRVAKGATAPTDADQGCHPNRSAAKSLSDPSLVALLYPYPAPQGDALPHTPYSTNPVGQPAHGHGTA